MLARVPSRKRSIILCNFSTQLLIIFQQVVSPLISQLVHLKPSFPPSHWYWIVAFQQYQQNQAKIEVLIVPLIDEKKDYNQSIVIAIWTFLDMGPKLSFVWNSSSIFFSFVASDTKCLLVTFDEIRFSFDSDFFVRTSSSPGRHGKLHTSLLRGKFLYVYCAQTLFSPNILRNSSHAFFCEEVRILLEKYAQL